MDFEIKDGCLVKYTGEDTEVVVPDGVTSIGNEVFSWCRSLTSVTIPNGVTNIGDMAFYKSSLTSVRIPDSVTSIGDSTFYECSSLTSVTIPDSVTNIGKMAFYGSGLTSVTVPAGVTSIEWGVFEGCGSLTSVTIPNSVTSIGFSAFSGCRSLTNIVIPDTVQELSHGVFYGCSNLQTIRMSYDLLKTHPFCPSSKTITLELTKAGEVVETVPAVYRKDYPSVSNWIHNDDCLVPIGKDEISYFDNLIAAGTYDGFTINENGRVAAILWRLNKKDVPIKEEILSVIREFLIGKLSKTIKYAMQENPLEHIRDLISIGVISSENEQQVVKLLKKSTDEDVRKISAMLGQLIAENKPAHLDDEKPFPLDDRFKEAYMAASVYPKMLKLGIEIPELKAADGNGYVPKECIQLFIAMYMDADGVIPLADEAAQMIERDTLNAVLLKNYEKQATIKDKLSLLNAVMRFADEKTVRTVF